MDILNRKGLQYSNYFDDFFKEGGFADKYRQILFHPGRVLQSRELTQLQTLLNEYSKAHLDNVFKNGSVVQGCYLTTFHDDDNNTDYIKLEDGLVYFDGSMYKISDLKLELNNDFKHILESQTPINKINATIGIMVNYEIISNTGDLSGVDSDEQLSLLDPAIQYFDAESTIGADRLKVYFNLVLKIKANSTDYTYFYNNDGSVINTSEFDYENIHYFDVARTLISYGDVVWEPNTSYHENQIIIPTISNGYKYKVTTPGDSGVIEPIWSLIIGNTNIDNTITWTNDGVESTKYSTENVSYLNRNYKFKDVDDGVTNIEDSILEGLDIQSNNDLDLNINSIINKQNDIYNNLTYFNVSKGIGKINGEHVPTVKNTLFKFDKPSKLPDGSNSGVNTEAINSYKDDNSNEGVYFKYFVENNHYSRIGAGPYSFDHSENFQFMSVGRRVAIQEYDNSNGLYYTIAKANICNIDNKYNTITDFNQPESWDKFKYKGFWKENEKSLYIEGITEIDENVAKLYRDSSNSYTLKLTEPVAYDILNNNCNGGLQAIGQIFNYEDVEFEYKYVMSASVEPGIPNFTSTMYVVKHSSFNLNTAELFNNSKGGIIIINNELYTIVGATHITGTTTIRLQLARIDYTYMLNVDGSYSYNPSMRATDDITTKQSTPGNYTHDIKFIKYHLVKNILDDTTFTIEYNDNNTSDWSQLPTNQNLAEKFITITSPWDDMNGFQTIIRNSTNNKIDQRDKVITYEPIVPYLFNKYHIFAGDSLRLLNDITQTIPKNNYNQIGDEINLNPGYTTTLMKPGDRIYNGITNKNNVCIIKEIIDDNRLRIISSESGCEIATITYYTSYPGTPTIYEYIITLTDSYIIDEEILKRGDYIKIPGDNLSITDISSGTITALGYNNNNTYCGPFTFGDMLSQIVEDLHYTIGADFYNYKIENNDIFWDFKIEDIKNIGNPNNANQTNDNSFADSNNLGTFNISYHSSNFKNTYLNDIIFETGYSLNSIIDNDKSQRIVFVDELGNLNYDHVIEKGVNILTTPNLLIDDDILNDFNDLSLPFVEDELIDYSVNTLVNLDTEITNIDIEGNVDYASFNFNSSENILGIFQAYGNTNKDIDMFIKLQGTGVHDENKVVFTRIQDNVNVDYIINHQGHIINDNGAGSGDLGINIKHFNTNNNVENITFNIASFGEGSSIGRDYQIMGDTGEIINVEKASGMKFFVNLDMSVDNYTYHTVNETMSVADHTVDPSTFDIYKSDTENNVIHSKSAFFDPLTHVGKVFYIKDVSQGALDTKYYFFLIKSVESTTTIKVYGEVPDKFKRTMTVSGNYSYVPHSGFVIIDSSRIITSNITGYPNNKLWLPYEDSFKFQLSAYILSYEDENLDFTFTNSSNLDGTIIIEDEIKLEVNDPITLSLYKKVSKDELWDGNTITPGVNINNIDLWGSYHPFMRIRENLTKKYGKPLSYNHEPILYPTEHTELRSVSYSPTVEIEYNYILPDVVHFHLNTNGTITHLKTAPQQYNNIQPFYIQDKLYIGTNIIPPTLDNKSFLTTGNQIFNFNKDIVEYFDNRKVQSNVKTNNNLLTLQDIYALERRDLYFSTGKTFTYWELGYGTITPRLSKIFNVTNPNGLYNHTHYEYKWNKLVGNNAEFMSQLHSNDVIGIFKIPETITNVENNPDSKIYNTPTEICRIKQILNNNELIIDGELTTRANVLPSFDIILLPSSFNYNKPLLSFDYIVTSGQCIPSQWYIKREQEINYIQYLMNKNEYSIYNILNNDMSFGDGYRILKQREKKISFQEFLSQNQPFRVPGIDVFNNEILPIFQKLGGKIDLDITSSTKFKQYGRELPTNHEQNYNITLNPIDSFKILDTNIYETGTIKFNNENIVNDIKFTLNDSLTLNSGFYVGDTIYSYKGGALLNFKNDDNNNQNINWDFINTEQFFNISSVMSKSNDIDYNYILTNKVSINPKNNYKYLFRPTTFINTSVIDNVKLEYDKHDTLNGVSALTISDTVDLICPDTSIIDYTSSTPFINNETLGRFGTGLNRAFNGVYDIGIINTNILIDNNNDVTGINDGTGSPLTTGLAKFVKTSTNLKAMDSFNEINKDYSYIFDQINDAIYFEKYETDVANILSESNLNVYNIFDKNIRHENWEFITPNIYQTYEFNNSHMLNNIEFFIDTPGELGKKYKGKIAIFFGFLINGQITRSSIIHTKVVHFDSNNSHDTTILDDKISIILDTPIYIPKNKPFFIGFIKENTEIINGEECTFKYIENGEYDLNNDILVPFSANFNHELITNGVSYKNRLLKIDLTMNKYEKNIESVIISENKDVADKFIKLVTFSNNLIPNETSIKYSYSINGIGNDVKWYQFNINEEIPFLTSKDKFAFKVSIKTDNEYISPIFKKSLMVTFKYLELNTMGNPPIMNNTPITPVFGNHYNHYTYNNSGNKLEQIQYNTLTSNQDPFSWLNINGNDTIRYYGVGMNIKNIETRVNDYNVSTGGTINKLTPYMYVDYNSTKTDTGQIFMSKSYTTKYKLDRIFYPNIVQNQQSETVKIYRTVIDFINPYASIRNILNPGDKFFGVPVIVINPSTGKQIDMYNDNGYFEDLMKGLSTYGAGTSTLGGKWIVDIDGKHNSITITNNGGSSHSRGIGNIYGRKLIIKKLNNGTYRQIYEFVGGNNEHLEEVNLGMMVPAYFNDITGDYTYSVIKNIMFTCDTLTTTNPDEFHLTS